MDTVKISSSDEHDFEVARDIANMSVTISHMLADLGDDNDCPIPLPNVTGAVLGKCIQYCELYQTNAGIPSDEVSMAEEEGAVETSKPKTDTRELAKWEVEFFKDIEQSPLFEIILAANYLDINCLLQSACKTVANMIKGKTPEQIRDLFDIENDFTPEEEEQIKKENSWLQDI